MPIRILIADDHPQVRTAMREVLEVAGGWEIIEAGDGEEAVAKARENKPGLIILDLAMPTKDGLTASREISEFLPGTPILLHTLYSSPQIRIEAAKAGVLKVVPKSNTPALVSVVQEVLNPGDQPAPQEDLARVEEPVRPRTEDRIRELCAKILSTTNDAALEPLLSALRDLLHAHVESLRARLAEYPAISERRARSDVSPPATIAEAERAGKADVNNEAFAPANQPTEETQRTAESKSPKGS